jgi:chlorite dismutase
MSKKTINHFMFFKLTETFWGLPAEEKSQFFSSLQAEVEKSTLCANLYQISPMLAEIDFMLWSSAPVENVTDESHFFEGISRALSSKRRLMQPVTALWGYTRPSVYSRAPSAQEIDPLAEQRQPYLVLYPFVKTIQWYLLGKDTRQGMMNEHIRVGHQYPEIKQLLLYSFGVQDQEFVVVYETEDLYKFSELVNELRGSDVREYTERDTPVYTGIWRAPADLAGLFSGKEAGA